MKAVSIGNHSKTVARRDEQARIRSFYRDTLGCQITKQTDDIDYIRFDQGFFIAVMYRDEALTAKDLREAIWLEIRTDDPKELGDRILAFGVHRIEIPGADHLYFQAPGGQVFRVVRSGEDLSRFER